MSPDTRMQILRRPGVNFAQAWSELILCRFDCLNPAQTGQWRRFGAHGCMSCRVRYTMRRGGHVNAKVSLYFFTIDTHRL